MLRTVLTILRKEIIQTFRDKRMLIPNFRGPRPPIDPFRLRRDHRRQEHHPGGRRSGSQPGQPGGGRFLSGIGLFRSPAAARFNQPRSMPRSGTAHPDRPGYPGPFRARPAGRPFGPLALHPGRLRAEHGPRSSRATSRSSCPSSPGTWPPRPFPDGRGDRPAGTARLVQTRSSRARLHGSPASSASSS